MANKNKIDESMHKNFSDESEEINDTSISPIVTFGVLTDIQYADVEDHVFYQYSRLQDTESYEKRVSYYRNSLKLVKEAVNNWKEYEIRSNTKIKFVIQLGDIIDKNSKKNNDSLSALQRVINELNFLFKENENQNLNTVENNDLPKLLHICGNHEMYNFMRSDYVNLDINTARILKQNLNSNANFYTYDITNKLKLICLDYYQFSCLGYEETNEYYKQAFKLLTSYNKNSDLNSIEGLKEDIIQFGKFNAGLSQLQMDWLKEQLKICKDLNKKTIICGHIPIHPQACDPIFLAWNNRNVLELIWSFDHTVIAYFAGHDHKGGYFRDKNNIHHITFPAILETPPNSNAYATVKVYNNKVSFEGTGSIGCHEIYFD